MNLEYMKVSLFEISYQKQLFHDIIFFICTCICELSVYVLSYLKKMILKSIFKPKY